MPHTAHGWPQSCAKLRPLILRHSLPKHSGTNSVGHPVCHCKAIHPSGRVGVVVLYLFDMGAGGAEDVAREAHAVDLDWDRRVA
jgi:hypothetical protein